MTAKNVTIFVLLVALMAAGYYLWKKYGGTVVSGTAVLRAKPGVSLKDPCPGADQIWDAPSGKCIPLVEEPVDVLN